MVTICFTYFKSLTLAALEAALYSISKQDFSFVSALVIVDNDTSDKESEILKVIESLEFPVPVTFKSFKHGIPEQTHSWSTNVAVRESSTPWVLFTRADYLLDFTLVEKFCKQVVDRHWKWKGFITGNVYRLSVPLSRCEETGWRQYGPKLLQNLPGSAADYTAIDAGVWMTQRSSFEEVGGLHEQLTAWGHAQTHFQYKLHCTGVDFVRINEPLFFHPQHAGQRDLAEASQQLAAVGVDLKEMWARSHVHPYGR